MIEFGVHLLRSALHPFDVSLRQFVGFAVEPEAVNPDTSQRWRRAAQRQFEYKLLSEYLRRVQGLDLCTVASACLGVDCLSWSCAVGL